MEGGGVWPRRERTRDSLGKKLKCEELYFVYLQSFSSTFSFVMRSSLLSKSFGGST